MGLLLWKCLGRNSIEGCGGGEAGAAVVADTLLLRVAANGAKTAAEQYKMYG